MGFNSGYKGLKKGNLKIDSQLTFSVNQYHAPGNKRTTQYLGEFV